MITDPLLNLADADGYSPLDISEFSSSAFDEGVVKRNIFEKKKFKAWGNNQADAARCDFADNRASVSLRKGGFRSLSLWRKSTHGRTLIEIKEDPDMVKFFADNMAKFIASILGDNIDPNVYAIVTTPKRRHKVRNFASLVSDAIADILGITFYEDVAEAKSKHRCNAVFEFNNIPQHHSLIVFDDFITTGETLHSMKVLLDSKGFNCIYFAAVNNKL